MNSGRLPALIVDVDGTLCDVRSIRHLVEVPEGGKRFRRDFNAFHSASLECPAHSAVVELVARLQESGLETLIVSARESRWSFLTALWLSENGVSYDEMYLRAGGDGRPDAVIKREFANRIVQRFLPVVAVDDRDEIIAVWHSFEIPTIKVLSNGALGVPVFPARWRPNEYSPVITQR